jgi:dihydroneopterin aldolase
MKFTIQNYKTSLSLGIYPIEKTIKNNILVTIIFVFDATKASISDDITDTIDYDNICKAIDYSSNLKHYNLIEHYIKELKATILKLDNRIKDINISVKKLSAVPKADFVMIETN